MRLAILGPVAVFDDEGTSRPLHRSQQLLLAALVAHRGESVPVPRLAEMVWGNEQPADPAAALRSQMTRLRRVLPSQAIITEAGAYKLVTDRLEVDADLLEALLGEAADAAPAERVRLLRRARQLWRGTPFGDAVADPAVAAEIARLEERHASVVESFAEALAESGDVAGAIAELRAHVHHHPYREKPRELLMRYLAHARRVPEALEAYQSYRRLLAEELGLDPSPRLAELERELVTGTSGSPDESAPRLAVTWSATRTGHRVATGTMGTGRKALLLPPCFSNMQEMANGRDVVLSPLFEALTLRLEVVTYDRSGTGLTAGDTDDLTLSGAVDEAEDVLATVGRMPVIARSGGGPIALALAARRPDLVSALVLVGAFASGPRAFPRGAVRDAVVELVRSHWGLGSRLIADLWLPDAAPADLALTATSQRAAAPPDVASAYLDAMYRYDASGVVGQVRQPVLVVHYEQDMAIPFAEAQRMAADLPSAELVPLAGRRHLPTTHDAPLVAERTVEFLGPV